MYKTASRWTSKAVPTPLHLYSITDASLHTGIPVETLRRWARQGLITAQRRGNLWKIDIDSAIAYSRTSRPGPKPKPR